MTPRQAEAKAFIDAYRDEGKIIGATELGRLMGISPQSAQRLMDRLRLYNRIEALPPTEVATDILARCRLIVGMGEGDAAGMRIQARGIMRLLGEEPNGEHPAHQPLKGTQWHLTRTSRS